LLAFVVSHPTPVAIANIINIAKSVFMVPPFAFVIRLERWGPRPFYELRELLWKAKRSMVMGCNPTAKASAGGP